MRAGIVASLSFGTATLLSSPLITGCQSAGAMVGSLPTSVQHMLPSSLAPEASGSSTQGKNANQDFSHLSAKNADIEVEIVRTILPGSPEAVVKPTWVEYVVRARNLTRSPIAPKEIRLIDEKGAYLAQAKSTTELIELPSATGALATQGALQGGTMLLGTMVPGLFAMPGMGSMAATAFSGASTALPTMQVNQVQNAAEQIQKRGWQTKMIDGKGEATGSIWLPVTSNPRAFVAEYEVNGQTRTLRIPTPRDQAGAG